MVPFATPTIDSLTPDVIPSNQNRGLTLNSAEAFQRAVALHQHGGLREAEEIYRAILEVQPNHFGSLQNLGVLYTNLSRPTEAVSLLQKALEQDPNSADACVNLGNALQALNRHQEAIVAYDRALAIEPSLASAHNNYGNALLMLNRPADAVTRYEKAIAINPGYAEAHYHLGCALQALDRHREAMARYEFALAVKPGYVEAHNNLGNALQALDRPEAAVAHYRRAITIKPDYAEAWMNLAAVLLSLGRHEEAVACLEKLMAMRPDFAEVHHGLGNAYEALCRHEEAIACFQRSIALRPGYAEAHWHEGQARLALGDYPVGWEKWEYRLLLPTSKRREFPQPQLRGGEILLGKTVFLYAEPGEGFGDTLQFCRYVPLVARQGAKVVLEVQAALRPLLAGLPGVSVVHAAGNPLVEFDYHCPLMSLPYAFKTTLATIPVEVPYLAPTAEKVEKWRATVGAGDPPLVGLAWSGRLRTGKFRNRPIPLRLLTPILEIPGLRFVALQKDMSESDRQVLSMLSNVLDMGGRLEDFSDTAAALSLMDLVITVDTSVAHLAGALGRPVWIMLQFAADWRWLRGRQDSPWYPTARLIRQPTPGDWQSVATSLRAEVERWARERESSA